MASKPTEPSKKDANVRPRTVREAIILAATVVVGLAAFWSTLFSGVTPDIASVGVFVVGVAAMAALMDRHGWVLWWITLLAGYAVGLWNASRLVPYAAQVPGAFDAGLVAALVFAGLGFVIGMVAEFVRFLHTLTHAIVHRNKKDDGKGPRHGQWTATTTN